MVKRRKGKRKFRLKHLIILLIIFGISKTLINQKFMMKDLTKRKIEEEQRIAQLEKEINELDQEIEEKDSLAFIEKMAREELRMVKPREMIYVDKNKDKNYFMNFRRK